MSTKKPRPFPSSTARAGFITAVALIALPAWGLAGCEPGTPSARWTNFDTGANVKAIALDGRYLWLGLPNGVIRYDAATNDTHEVYTSQHTQGGILSNGIYTIRLDPHGRPWIGTYGGGLSVRDGGDWLTFTPYGAGRVRSYGADWVRYGPGQGLGDLWVYDIAFAPQGTMWVATWKGLSRFDGWPCLAAWRKGQSVAAAPLPSCGFTTFNVADGLVDKWVYAIAVDRDGALWLGTEGGVNRFDGTRWTTYTHRDGLGADASRLPPPPPRETPSPHHTHADKTIAQANPNYVLAITIDRKGRKWFGTWGAGLSRYDGARWETYTTTEGLGGNYIHALGIDSQGLLWAGTDGGASWYDGRRWRTYTTRDGLLDNNVFSMAFASDGTRWFGTWRGLSKLEIIRR